MIKIVPRMRLNSKDSEGTGLKDVLETVIGVTINLQDRV